MATHNNRRKKNRLSCACFSKNVGAGRDYECAEDCGEKGGRLIVGVENCGSGGRCSLSLGEVWRLRTCPKTRGGHLLESLGNFPIS